MQNGSQPHAMTPRSGSTTPRRLGLSGDAVRVPKLNMTDSSSTQLLRLHIPMKSQQIFITDAISSNDRWLLQWYSRTRENSGSIWSADLTEVKQTP